VIGIVIVAHGGLAREYRAALEHVVGPLQAVETIMTSPDDNRSRKQAEICAAADRVDDGSGVVIVTDMWGGSPSNLSLRACSPANRRIVFGANLPLLIKLAKSRSRPVDEAVQLATDAGRKYIDSRIVPHEPFRAAAS
jgi:mannose PTS system EIIA component